MTPTTALLANVTHGNRSGYHGNGQTQWGGLSGTTESSSPNIVAEGSTSALIINDIRESVVNRSESATTLPLTWRNEQSGSYSTSTVETTLAQTPSEPPASHPKSQNINAMTNQPLPPHQGRNPIVERNTHKRSDEELAVVGKSISSYLYFCVFILFLYPHKTNFFKGILESASLFVRLCVCVSIHVSFCVQNNSNLNVMISSYSLATVVLKVFHIMIIVLTGHVLRKLDLSNMTHYPSL